MKNLSAKYRALEGIHIGDDMDGLLLWTGDAFRRFCFQVSHFWYTFKGGGDTVTARKGTGYPVVKTGQPHHDKSL